MLTRAGRYREVYLESADPSKLAPLKVKEIRHEGKRYIVCINGRQACKDVADRPVIVDALQQQLKKGAKSLVGNKGYRKYLKIEKNSVAIDAEKIKADAVFDEKWALITNTGLSGEQTALKYKELWRVERVIRDVQSLLETCPVFHQNDAKIADHVSCSFLAIVLRKELEQRLSSGGHPFEWLHIKQNLEALKQVVIEENGQRFALLSECRGNCGKIFQAIGVALSPQSAPWNDRLRFQVVVPAAFSRFVEA